MNPESPAHWTFKNLLAKELRRRLEYDIPFLVGYFADCCDGVCETAKETPIPVFENLLEAVASIEVESAIGNRIPDITLRRDRLPDRVIEIVVTSPPTPVKIAEYANAGVEAFALYARDRKSVARQIRPFAPPIFALTLNACRQPQRKRLRELMQALDSTPDATFGVVQPELNWDESNEDRLNRVSSSTTYIAPDGSPMTDSYDIRPSYQKFVVAGKTVSKADLFSVIGHVKAIADINGLNHLVGHTLWEMVTKIRHANGEEKRVRRLVKPMAEYPLEDKIEWESARSPYGSALLYYERIFHKKRAMARMTR